jgi:hypothetical protein
MHTLAPALLLAILSPTFGAASPQPALISSDYAMSLVPRHTLFLRQMNDLQTFDSALAGVRASSIVNSGSTERPFKVGDDTFPDFATAAQRSCDEQFQGCQKAANEGGNKPPRGEANKPDGNGADKPSGKEGDKPSGKEGDKPPGGGEAKGKGKNRGKRQNEGGLSVGDCDQQKSELCFSVVLCRVVCGAVADKLQTSALIRSRRRRRRILRRACQVQILDRILHFLISISFVRGEKV